MTNQKKLILHVIACVCVFVCAIFCGQASVHGASVPYATGLINDTEGVNIRSTYSTSGNIVGGAPYQGVVLITKERFTSSTSTAKTTRWYYVQSSYGNGWIRSDFLDLSYGKISGKITDTVNVRKGAGTAFDSVAELNEGDMVDVRLTVYSSTGVKWYKVYYNKYYRYIHASYVELQEPAPDNSAGPMVNENFDAELAAFPSSYHGALKKLHERYPSWHFKAKALDYTWNDALSKMISNYKTNTIPSSKPDSYKKVSKETYNFDKRTYLGMDGSSWVAASKKAVAYYMDPRNWLDEINVFMFESLIFDAASQTEAMVQELLASTAIPKSYSSSYMTAGVTYNISPVYLAAKSKLELGSSSFMVDGHQFTYGGKTYKGYYNAYNIGASDSASGGAALNGLYYAASGTSYLRPWNTLDKAIRGGAKFIAEDFVGNNQHTAYYEHFNVANGLANVGTHVYMTNTMAAATHANITYWNYSDNQMLDTAFTFEIPVYQSMPTTAAAAPGAGNNNCYLDTLKVYNGDTRLYFKTTFDRFISTYTLKNSVGAEVKELTIKSTANAADAKITVSGNTDLQIGENKINVKVTSSAGVVKNYYINVTRLSTSSVVVAPDIKMSSDAQTGKPVISWEKAVNADQYKVYRSTSNTGTYKLLKTLTSLNYTDKTAEPGTKYYYKVKSVGTSGIIGEAMSESKYRTCDLPRPVVTPGNRGKDGCPQLKWTAVDGVLKYEIHRADSIDGTYKKMYTQKSTTYTNTNDITLGTTYYYKVKAIHENVEANSAFSEIQASVHSLAQPVVTAGNRESDGKPQLKWSALEGAVKYEIYRSASKDGEFTKTYTTAKTTYTNTKAEPGKTYYYRVKALHQIPEASSVESEPVEVKCLFASLTAKASNRDTDGKPTVTWNTIEGAEQYEIYRALSEDGTYKKMKTVTTESYTNTSAKVGKTYYYKVKAIGNVSEDGEPIFSQVVYGTCRLPQPVTKISNQASDGKIKLSWDKIEGADKYKIYVSTKKNGTYKRLNTKTGTSCVHTKAVAGQRYYYKVKAIYADNEEGDSAYSSPVYRVCDLARPTITLSRRDSDGKTKITWKKVEGASQYVIYYATSKNGTYKKLSTKTGTVHTHTKGVSGTTYYYKVKAICGENVNGNSAYSTIKSMKSR